MENSLSILAFVVGFTQLIKDTKIVKGQWLKLVAIGLGGLGSYLFQYHPNLWIGMSEVILAASATGIVSFAGELKKK